MPMAVYTFLEKYDLSGKTIIPFCTHGGSRFGSSIEDIKKLCPQATMLDGFEISGGRADSAQEDVNAWLREIGMSE